MTRNARDALGDILTQLYPGLVLDDIHHGLDDADRILAKLAEGGHKIVPAEPTQRMQRLGAAKMWDINKQTGRTIGYDQAAEIYRAMLAAIDGNGK